MENHIQGHWLLITVIRFPQRGWQKLTELVPVLYLSCGWLWAAELSSWHPSTVLKIHFGFWVCFSVNQLPIHCISLSRLFFKSFQSSKARLYRLFPDLLSQSSWQDPMLWTWSAESLLRKGRWGKEEGKTEMWVQKKELNSKKLS